MCLFGKGNEREVSEMKKKGKFTWRFNSIISQIKKQQYVKKERLKKNKTLLSWWRYTSSARLIYLEYAF